ncbi:carbohydrate ABC transporter permease [Diplocloster modestus]|uniref:Sugar ABC transporter permease n=1 Tax=Diplocloster modestus TaxID=2850322 RepID=A0ABS6K6Z9_9FIRM|nr:sugar ABC transporter permease [Diplocloster modestus]MBU9726268.1 sugar ABC transporter permease [Diplocloster modestus]
MRKKYLAPVMFLLPAMLGIFIFKLYPIFLGMYDSFFQYSFQNKRDFFVGIQNYVDAFQDPSFLNSLAVTLIFNVIVNPLQVVLSFGLALLLMVKLKGQKAFRTLHLIPITVSFTIACVLWGVLLNPEQGLMNSILNTFGIPNQQFLYSSSQALPTIIGIASWKGLGYWALFFIAGLEEVPSQLYEASSIDGAGYWRSLRYITMPNMKRTFLFVIVSDTISNYLMFVPSYILTNGGPEGSTDFLMFRIFTNAYSYSNVNLASAMIVILLVIMMATVGIENLLLREKV